MTIDGMIGHLQRYAALYGGTVPVAIADWQEGLLAPSLTQAENMAIREHCIVGNVSPPSRIAMVLVLGEET